MQDQEAVVIRSRDLLQLVNRAHSKHSKEEVCHLVVRVLLKLEQIQVTLLQLQWSIQH
jgi:hypothetical protein